MVTKEKGRITFGPALMDNREINLQSMTQITLEMLKKKMNNNFIIKTQHFPRVAWDWTHQPHKKNNLTTFYNKIPDIF